jgi:hypothetical protein
VPDLLGPGLAHHRLEPGLASLKAGLDHLRVGLGPGLGPGLGHLRAALGPGLHHLWADLGHLSAGLGPDLDHHGLDPGIYLRPQLGAHQELCQRVLPHLQGFEVFIGIEFKTHVFVKKLHGKLIYLFCRGSFLAKFAKDLPPPK